MGKGGPGDRNAVFTLRPGFAVHDGAGHAVTGKSNASVPSSVLALNY
jgi:hypothetical protein